MRHPPRLWSDPLLTHHAILTPIRRDAMRSRAAGATREAHTRIESRRDHRVYMLERTPRTREVTDDGQWRSCVRLTPRVDGTVVDLLKATAEIHPARAPRLGWQTSCRLPRPPTRRRRRVVDHLTAVSAN